MNFLAQTIKSRWDSMRNGEVLRIPADDRLLESRRDFLTVAWEFIPTLVLTRHSAELPIAPCAGFHPSIHPAGYSG